MDEVETQRRAAGTWDEEARASVELAVQTLHERIDAAEREVAEKSSVRQRGIMSQLNAIVRNRFARYAIGASLALEAGGVAGFVKYQEAKEAREQVELAEAKERERQAPPTVEVNGLDAYATPERMQRLLAETLPKGWANTDVASISFKDEDKPMQEHYGMAGAHTVAEAGKPSGESKTHVTFYRGAKPQTSAELWGNTLLHEVGHANDWVRDTQMSEEEKKALHVAVIARLDAPNRYQSGYVESVKNKDAETEKETKALEYWADISSLYLRSADPKKELSDEDRALVEGAIKKTDPTFDQKKAREARERIIKEMTDAKAADAETYVATVVVAKEKRRIADELKDWKAEPEEKAEFMAWFEAQTAKTERDPLDPTQQREGRDELVTAMKRFGVSRGRRDFMTDVVRSFHWRKKMVEAYGAGNFEAVSTYHRDFSDTRKKIRRTIETAKSPAEFRLIGETIERIIAEHDLLSPEKAEPGKASASALEKGEFVALLDWKAGEQAHWIIDATEWEVPRSDDEKYFALLRKANPWLEYHPK